MSVIKPVKDKSLRGAATGDAMQKKIFANNLKRIVGNRSQRDVADRLGVSYQTFNNWYQGKSVPRIGVAQKIADTLRVPLADLIMPQPEVIVLEGKEEGEDIKEAYNAADDVTKEMVRRILKLDDPE